MRILPFCWLSHWTFTKQEDSQRWIDVHTVVSSEIVG